MLCRFCQAIVILRIALGVKCRVAEVLEERPVDVICARTRRETYLAARIPAIFRSVARGLNLELLQRVDRYQALCRSQSSLRGRASAHSTIVACSIQYSPEIRRDTIYGEIISIGSLTINTVVAGANSTVTSGNGSWRELDQILKASAVQRHILNKFVGYRHAHGGGSIDLTRAVSDSNGLRRGTNLQLKINLNGIFGVKHEVRLHNILKTGLLDFNFVVSWR